MTAKVVNLPYTPRKLFRPFHQRTKRRAVVVCHRRFGKTVGVLWDIIFKALYFNKVDHVTKQPLKRPHFVYVCPYKDQAKSVAWDYLVDFTKDIRSDKNESELWVEVPTLSGEKAKIYLRGADNPDSLRGNYYDGAVLDEYGDMKPEVYSTVIRPALSDRKGWVVFMGTPKGDNDFYKRKQMALADPSKYFFLEVKASENPEADPAEIADMKEEMEPEEWAQELECDFHAAFKGAFYGKAMTVAEGRGCFRKLDYVPGEKVCCSLDVGHTDATVVNFWQVVDGEVRFFDHWHATEVDAEEVAEMLSLKPYDYERVWLPHDGKKRTFSTKKTPLETFESFGLPVGIAKNPETGRGVQNGVDAVRKFLRLWPFAMCTERAGTMISALKNYSRQFNRVTKKYTNTPEHDHWSDHADAFRYGVLMISEEDIGRSIERAKHRRYYQHVNGRAVNTRRLTLDEAFAAREREMWRAERDPGSAYE